MVEATGVLETLIGVKWVRLDMEWVVEGIAVQL